MSGSPATPAVTIDVSGWHAAPFDVRGESVFAVGDVHGCAAQLQALLTEIAGLAGTIGAPTRLVLLGDLIDRGPSSLGALDLWSREAAAHGVDQVHRLMGNHEMTLLLAIGDGPHAPQARERWLGAHMGGTAVLEEMRARAGRADAPLDRALVEATLGARVCTCLHAMEPHLRLGNVLFVHGGLRPQVDIEAYLSRPWTGFLDAQWAWIMADFLQWKEGFDGTLVVHGHTPPVRHHELTGEDDPHQFIHDRLGLDGGSSRNGIVTAAQIEDGRYRILRALGQPAGAPASTAVSHSRVSNSS
ncbi:MAG: metallophosphoesterase [bacterium]|jgi:serine/threonine protein phosphatase 1|nr:metallophosphoesterase [Betaproteobacteria bacterium]